MVHEHNLLGRGLCVVQIANEVSDAIVILKNLFLELQ